LADSPHVGAFKRSNSKKIQGSAPISTLIRGGGVTVGNWATKITQPTRLIQGFSGREGEGTMYSITFDLTPNPSHDFS